MGTNAKTYFIIDEYSSAHRVWREGQPGDVFLVMKTPETCSTYDIGEMLKKLAEFYPDQFVYGDPEDED